jgi:hypothetical protein
MTLVQTPEARRIHKVPVARAEDTTFDAIIDTTSEPLSRSYSA